GRRRIFAALAGAALVAWAGAAGANPQSVIELCTSDREDGTGAAAHLARLMSTARIEIRRPPCAAPAGGRYLATLEEREGAVHLHLVDSGGARLERRVPWLTRLERPLARLELEGRLTEFSLLLESLLAEARAGPLLVPEPIAPVVADPTPAPKSIGRSTDGKAVRKRSRPAKAPAPAEAVAGAPVPGGSPDREAPATSGSEGVSAPAIAPGEAPDATVASAAAGGASAAASPTEGGSEVGDDAGPADLDPGPAEGEETSDPASFTTSAAPHNTDANSPAASAETGPSDAGALDPPEAFWSGWSVQVSGVGGLRLRGPGLSSPEAGLRVSFGPLWIRGAMEGEAEWNLGTPIRVGAASASAGAEVPLFGKGAWGAAALAGVGVDQVELRRADFAGARRWSHRDVGPLGGLRLGWESGPVASGLLVEAQWMPTARRIWLPEGTSGVLGRWSLRAGVTLGWKR
ncbi:MAG TPA: hypothetical protein VN033_12885, partial [Vulgatibacter sp.]|nr:hypothetical protein [Vulgatibacter sp.]